MVRYILVFLLLGVTGYIQAQEFKVEKSTEKIVFQGKSYYLHTVKAKETLFSICKAYGVLTEDVKSLNGKEDNSLSIGEVLRIPVIEPFKLYDDQYYYHRMRPKETLYSLSRKFRIKMKRILKDNPEYDVSRPIAECAVVRLALKQIDRNVLEAELRWEERQMKEEQRQQAEQREREDLMQINQLAQDSMDNSKQLVVDESGLFSPDKEYERRHVKVALLLPLYVKNNKLPLSMEEISVDTLGVNVRDERWRLYNRTESFLQFYQGALMAVDSLKRMGYTIDLYVYDTERDVNTMPQIVEELNALSPDLIVGPMYGNTYKAVAEQLTNKLIPMIYPLSSRGEDLVRFPNFVQLNTSTSSLMDEMADWIAANATQAHVIQIVPDKETKGGEEKRLISEVQSRFKKTETK